MTPLPVYHGNNRRPGDTGVGAYSAGALLLDLENPSRILATRGEILVPETDYERQGFVPNVIFPTGVVARDETLLVYYGAADETCAVMELRLRDLLSSMPNRGTNRLPGSGSANGGRSVVSNRGRSGGL